MSKEIWKVSRKYPYYEVSNLGNVKRIFSDVWAKLGAQKTSLSGRGYLQVHLCKNKKYVSANVHSLVANEFLGERPLDLEINHINGNKKDNRAENLEYVTSSQNQVHALKLGLYVTAKGERAGRAKLKEVEVREIKAQLSEGVAQNALAKKFNVTPPCIWLIKKGINWKHLSEVK